MQNHRIQRILFFAFISAVMLAWYTWLDRYVTFESIKEHRALLYSFVEKNYLWSVAVFIAATVSTGLFVPASIPLILIGGFLFGIFWGAFYVCVGFLVGAVIAFVFSRYLIGRWVQHHYGDRLEAFNSEVERHGRNYLIILRMIPLFPFFTVNYFAGLTKIPLSRFMWVTVIGMLPSALVYAFAGKELGKIQSPGDILTPKFIAVLVLLVLFTLFPVIHHHMDRMLARRRVRL